MALVTCPDCGRDVSSEAPTCIGCGRPMKAMAPPEPPAGEVSAARLVVTTIVLVVLLMVLGSTILVAMYAR